MSRTIFLVDSFYPSVLASEGLDRRRPGQGYEAELARALGVGFGTGSIYGRELTALGWHPVVAIGNARGLQQAWAAENGVRQPFGVGWQYGPHLGRLPIVSSLLHRLPHLHRLLLSQVEQLQPDVVMVQDLNLVPAGLGRALRRHTGLLVGEIASPPPPRRFFEPYDLIVSALPSTVEMVRGWGGEAESLPLGFDPSHAGTSPASQRPIDAIFVGSFSRHQPATAPLLRAVASRVPGLQIYGDVSPRTLTEAGLSDYYRGPAWGREMFELLGRSKTVINRHGSIAGPYAVNMRMFESTGSGAALVTERQQNLAEFFVPGEEVLAYDSFDEAARLTAEILADPPRLDRVAAAGRARTLGTHTYAHRAAQLSALLEERLGRSEPRRG